MTVKELKKALNKVPDNVEVLVLIDSWESHYESAWSAGYYQDEDEEGNTVERFTINC